MKKGLFDIILDQIMKERDLEENTIQPPKDEQSDEEKTLEEQAKEEVKKREKKKLDELLNKAKKEKEEKLAQAKRKAKKIAAEQKKADAHKANVSALESPTKNIQWKCITSGNHLHGSVNDVAIFEIKRGASKKLFPHKVSYLGKRALFFRKPKICFYYVSGKAGYSI